jgi:Tol biopolymer transport system component
VLRVATPKGKGLAILDVDSGRLTSLTSDAVDNLPKWSPKGDAIAFTTNRDGDWEIYAIRPDGTGLTRLTNSPGNDAHAAWSPDGRWLAFSSARGGFKDETARGGGGGQGATDIFVMRPDGKEAHTEADAVHSLVGEKREGTGDGHALHVQRHQGATHSRDRAHLATAR